MGRRRPALNRPIAGGRSGLPIRDLAIGCCDCPKGRVEVIAALVDVEMSCVVGGIVSTSVAVVSGASMRLPTIVPCSRSRRGDALARQEVPGEVGVESLARGPSPDMHCRRG